VHGGRPAAWFQTSKRRNGRRNTTSQSPTLTFWNNGEIEDRGEEQDDGVCWLLQLCIPQTLNYSASTLDLCCYVIVPARSRFKLNDSHGMRGSSSRANPHTQPLCRAALFTASTWVLLVLEGGPNLLQYFEQYLLQLPCL